jgi:hypothetical protein
VRSARLEIIDAPLFFALTHRGRTEQIPAEQSSQGGPLQSIHRAFKETAPGYALFPHRAGIFV